VGFEKISVVTVKASLATKAEFLGAWLLVLGCFAVPVLGTAATNIFLLSALGIWLLRGQFKVLPALARQYPLILLCFGLFLWLGFSACWSSSFTGNILYLSKYREFFMIPAFMWVFSQKEYRTLALKALFLGMLLTLVISFLQYFHVATFHGRQHSAGNHIFHGILFAFFSYWCLDLARKYRAYAWLFVLLFLISSFALFEIQNGRTGYVLFSLLTALFLFQHFGWKVLILSAITLTLFLFYAFEPAQILGRTHGWGTQLINEDLTLQSLATLDARFELWINALKIIADNWLLGVGLGDYGAAHRPLWEAWHHAGFFINPHNEYLMIWSQSGLVGIALFIAFHGAFFNMARRLSKDDAPVAMATLVTIIVSCSFNSSFLDMNDGALLLILSALFLAPGVNLTPQREGFWFKVFKKGNLQKPEKQQSDKSGGRKSPARYDGVKFTEIESAVFEKMLETRGHTRRFEGVVKVIDER